MKCISSHVRHMIDEQVFQDIEIKYSIQVRNDVKQFFQLNNGGFPKNDIITIEGEEYEVRVFLSLDPYDKYYFIEKPLKYFMEKTNGKIIPIGIDSGDNYYCVNNVTGKVYYWVSDGDTYYLLADNIKDFVNIFE